MARYQWPWYGLLILMLSIMITAEIHRAKTYNHRNGAKSSRAHSRPGDKYSENVAHVYRSEFGSEMGLGEVDMFMVWTFSIGGSILVGLSGILPVLVIPFDAGPALKHGVGAARLKLLLSFAVGGLLGDVFLHLLPEAYSHVDKENHDHFAPIKIGLWVLCGILSFLIIEKVFSNENDRKTDEPAIETKSRRENDIKKTRNAKTRTKNNNIKPIMNGTSSQKSGVAETDMKLQRSPSQQIKVSGYLNLMANVIDNFTHGLAVAGSFLVSQKVGMITTFAIMVHEIPHEFGDFAILLRSGFDRWKAAKAQILTATGGLVGAIVALTAESAQSAGDTTAWILPFTSGGFIYIALVTVVPDLLEEKNVWESIKQVLCLTAGISAMFLVTLVID